MGKSDVRSQSDLDRVGRTLGEHFKTDLVVIVGSQSVLVGWPSAPEISRTSGEIDAFPANAKEWEDMPENVGLEASEEINAFFGDGSTFSETHGFYIDGVDNTTAKLHRDWKSRAVFRDINSYGKTVTMIAPSVEDMAVSKLIRLEEKDRGWLTSCHSKRPFDKANLLRLTSETTDVGEKVKKAKDFLDTLPDKKPHRTPTVDEIPNYDRDTHCITISGSEGTLFVRAWDDRYGLYNKVDNHLGPAVITKDESLYFLEGKKYPYDEWLAHPRVVAARDNTHDEQLENSTHKLK